jgi:hypothetical protein
VAPRFAGRHLHHRRSALAVAGVRSVHAGGPADTGFFHLLVRGRRIPAKPRADPDFFVRAASEVETFSAFPAFNTDLDPASRLADASAKLIVLRKCGK